MQQNFLSRLNERQIEAVTHYEGPLLVLAGAGSGKTTTMAHRMAYLVVKKKVPAQKVLGLSFTNKAANELGERVQKLVRELSGSKSKGKKMATPLVCTFHKLCVLILREHAEKIGYKKGFHIIDDSDQESIVREILGYVRSGDKRFDAGKLVFAIGSFKTGTPIQSLGLDQEYHDIFEVVVEKYQQQLKMMNCMDFDDLLLNTEKVLKIEAVAQKLQREYSFVMVDEFQDTNPSQFRILKGLLGPKKNVCVVGDDDQSIYAWRGGDSSLILNFARHFEGSKLVMLDQNYRSTSTILKAANAVIAQNPKRYPKELWSSKGEGEAIQEVVLEDDREEADWVAQEIEKRATEYREGRRVQSASWNDFAILFRSNTQARAYETNLRSLNIPYRLVGGYSFFDRKEVRDLLAYIRVILNPSDDLAFRRMMAWPRRGIGMKTIEQLQEIAQGGRTSLFAAVAKLDLTQPRLASLHTEVQKLMALKGEMKKLQPNGADLSHWISSLISTFSFRASLEAECKDSVQASKRYEIFEEMVQAVGQFRPKKAKTAVEFLSEFLASVALDSKDEEEDEKKDKQGEVTLMTLHGAKGLEFKSVFLVGLDEGLLPHKRVIEEASDLSEERRLFYVGITRAQEKLCLVRTRNRIRYGKPVAQNKCRFLDDIPREILQTSDLSSDPVLETAEAKDAHEERVKSFLADIRSRMQ